MIPVRNVDKKPDLQYAWGNIRWLCNGEMDPQTEMTFGVVTIDAGKANPRHCHPNCEEHIYILQSQCNHSLGDESVALWAGDMLRVPRSAPHNAVNTGSEPVVMVVTYSAPNRMTVGEGGDFPAALTSK